MFKIHTRLTMAIALLGVCAGAAAQDASVTGSAPIGVTTVETFGGGGFHQDTSGYLYGAQTRHKHCQTEFGPGARMCTSQEVLQAPSTAFGLIGWLAPAGIGAVHTGKTMKFYDTATGVIAPQAGRLNCDQHLTVRNPSGKKATGLFLNDRGKITLAACDEPHPIVCCAGIERLVP